MTGLKASAVYGEVLAGIKVKIVGNFSLGWNARYHMKFKVSSKSSSSPWFIPGYGATSPFSFSLFSHLALRPAENRSRISPRQESP